MKVESVYSALFEHCCFFGLWGTSQMRTTSDIYQLVSSIYDAFDRVLYPILHDSMMHCVPYSTASCRILMILYCTTVKKVRFTLVSPYYPNIVWHRIKQGS